MSRLSAVLLAVLLLAGGWMLPDWLELRLLVLAALTLWRPAWGLAALLATVSLDGPVTFAGIVVQESEIVFAVVVLAWLAASSAGDLDWRPLWWSVPFLLAVALSGFAAVTWYKVPPHVMRAGELAAAFFAASNLSGRASAREPLRWGILLAALLYSGAGLLQLSGHWPSRLIYGPRAFSFFSNPNQFAAYLNLLLPVLLALSLGRGSRWWRWLCGNGLLLVLLALLGTLSRAGLLACLAGLLIMALVTRRRLRAEGHGPARELRRRLAPLALPLLAEGLLLVLIAIWVIPGGLSSLLEQQRANLTGRSIRDLGREYVGTRLRLAQAGWLIWRDHFWLGIGPGRYQEILAEYQPAVEALEAQLSAERDPALIPLAIDSPATTFRTALQAHTHNLPLQLAVEYGLLGLLGFGCFGFRIVQAMARRCMEDAARLAGLGCLAAFGIHNLFDVTFPSLALETGLVLGICFAARLVGDGGQTGSPPGIPARTPVSGETPTGSNGDIQMCMTPPASCDRRRPV